MPAVEEAKAKKPKAKKEPKAIAPVAANPLAIDLSAGVPEELPVKDIQTYRDLQIRRDVDTGEVVDETRAQEFAEAMKAGDEFPPIKVMRIPDPKKEGVTHLDVWDGMHTLRGAVLAKKKTIKCIVWDGSPEQALYAAATLANREHSKNGKPLSNKDKIQAATVAAKAYKTSQIAPKEWPSNRQLAELVGVSHAFVNDLDPFGRRKDGRTHEDRKAEKRAKEQQADDEGEEEGEEDTEEGASPRLKNVFDWKEQDRCLGFVIRSIDAMGDTFDLRRQDPAGYKTAVDACKTLAEQLRQWKESILESGKAA